MQYDSLMFVYGSKHLCLSLVTMRIIAVFQQHEHKTKCDCTKVGLRNITYFIIRTYELVRIRPHKSMS